MSSKEISSVSFGSFDQSNGVAALADNSLNGMHQQRRAISACSISFSTEQAMTNGSADLNLTRYLA